jgi:hypothetical protein
VGGATGFALQRYLDNLTSYAESSWEKSDVHSDHTAEGGTPHVESRSPPLDSVRTSGKEFMVLQDEVNIDLRPIPQARPLRTNYQTTKENYETPSNYQASSSIHSQHEDGQVSNAEISRSDSPSLIAHKRSTTPNGTRGKTKSTLECRRNSHHDQQGVVPNQISTAIISGPTIVDHDSTTPSDSRRSGSFGIENRKSGSPSASESSTQQDKLRELSLVPPSFSPQIDFISLLSHEEVTLGSFPKMNLPILRE